jgi:hypothetical protein
MDRGSRAVKIFEDDDDSLSALFSPASGPATGGLPGAVPQENGLSIFGE